VANTKSAIKRIRSSERKRQRNRVHRSRARTFVRKTVRQIDRGDLEGAETSLQQAISALDRAAQKGVIHKNNAARRKSRLMKRYHEALQSQG
jgi:small subunit ribosomal protein S20